jgi:hypothetical protein
VFVFCRGLFAGPDLTKIIQLADPILFNLDYWHCLNNLPILVSFLIKKKKDHGSKKMNTLNTN